MPYSVVDGFPSGVDRTRDIDSAPPGALWSGINGHLTRGGDFEVRKEFVQKYSVPGTFGLSRLGSELVVFGSDASVSVPSGVQYQRLEHPDGLSMTAIRSVDLFDGKIYAVAEYSDGSVMHFYDGQIVADWVNGVARASMTNSAGIAAHLAALIDADDAYSASSAGSVITIEAAVAGTPFTISSYVENVEGGNDDQSIVLATVTSNVPGVSEVLATGSFQITGGTSSPGVNKITSVKVNGVEILSSAVDWTTSHSGTATLVADQINTYASSPEYTATASGSSVVISAAAGSGASPNGFVVAVTVGGDVTVGSVANMAGGVEAVAGVKQKHTATVSGTFEIGDRYGITIDGKKFGAEGNPSPVGTVVRTHGRKIYAGSGRLVNFCGVDSPAGWNRDLYAGAGFENVSNHSGDSDDVTAFGKYLNYLAVMFENNVQVWYMDKDESVNSLSQTVGEIGTRSPKTVTNFGTLDLFFLAQTGIRSMRSRDQINLAGINDVGTSVDVLVKEQLDALTDEQVRDCCSVVDPDDGRYWCAVGDKIFVFSYFPTKKISGWTWYEPGVSFSDFVVINRRIYGRAGDNIYLYGGDGNDEYCTTMVTCVLPFQTFKRPATFKYLERIDLSLVGAWDVDILPNPNDEAEFVRVGVFDDGVSFGDEIVGALCTTTHIGVKITRTDASYGKVKAFAVHYTEAR